MGYVDFWLVQGMTTALEKTIKRALRIKGRDYVVALSPDNIKLTLKGHRLCVELKWADLVNGEAALATALHASLGKFAENNPPTPATGERRRKTR